MPYVNIKVTHEGSKPGVISVTAEQKAALIRGTSQLLLDILGKPLDSTFVVIDEIEMENWCLYREFLWTAPRLQGRYGRSGVGSACNYLSGLDVRSL